METVALPSLRFERGALEMRSGGEIRRGSAEASGGGGPFTIRS